MDPYEYVCLDAGHKRMRLYILCDGRRSICGVIFRKAYPAVLHISSLGVYRHVATIPLILPRNELVGVVRSELRGDHVNGDRFRRNTVSPATWKTFISRA
jgi:hypothetical protein